MGAPEWANGLTLMQRLYVEAYVGEAKGNATEAARIAGYASPENSARDNAGKPKIMQAVHEALEEIRKDHDVLTPEEIHAFWRRVVYDDSVEMKDRLKAASDAARAMAMFVDRKELRVESGVQVMVYLPDNGREVEDIVMHDAHELGGD